MNDHCLNDRAIFNISTKVFIKPDRFCYFVALLKFVFVGVRGDTQFSDSRTSLLIPIRVRSHRITCIRTSTTHEHIKYMIIWICMSIELSTSTCGISRRRFKVSICSHSVDWGRPRRASVHVHCSVPSIHIGKRHRVFGTMIEFWKTPLDGQSSGKTVCDKNIITDDPHQWLFPGGMVGGTRRDRNKWHVPMSPLMYRA